MRVRQRVTLLIVQDGKLLIIRRRHDGRPFFVIPGGGVEPGESVAAAAIREALEETSLHVTLGPQLWTRPITTPLSSGEILSQIEYAYLITHFSGTPLLNAAEFPQMSAENKYQLDWIQLDELAVTAVYPGPLSDSVLQTLYNYMRG